MKFQKGIPYTDALLRLNQAFRPKPGDLITHEALRAVIQADESRYRGILAAWRKELQAAGLRPTGQGRARGIGIAFLDGRQDMATIDHETVLAGRTTKRLCKRSENIDTTGFSDDELAHRNLQRRLLSEQARSFDRANKELRTPPPAVTGDNVRVLKTS
jgi:hypothetical protein